MPKNTKNKVPSAITAFRLACIPLLFLLVTNDLLFFGACLFLVLLGTDFADGFLARKWGVLSRKGTYFDVTTDFIFAFSLFMAWMSKGFCPSWILIVIAVIFVQFIVTSRYSEEIYDPVGKYFGSLLYGAAGLRFILSGQLFYNIVTAGIVISAAASATSRAIFFIKTMRAKPK
jgi:phosphatidylglycerophosphate synthase